MKSLKKAISVVLAALLLVSAMAVGVSAADGDVKITAGGKSYDFKTGEKADYTLSLKSADTVVNGQFYIYYPQSVLKIESVQLNPILGSPMSNYKNLTDEFRMVFSDVDGMDFKEEKYICKITFEVVGNENAEIKITKKKMSTGVLGEPLTSIIDKVTLTETIDKQEPESSETTEPSKASTPASESESSSETVSESDSASTPSDSSSDSGSESVSSESSDASEKPSSVESTPTGKTDPTEKPSSEEPTPTGKTDPTEKPSSGESTPTGKTDPTDKPVESDDSTPTASSDSSKPAESTPDTSTPTASVPSESSSDSNSQESTPVDSSDSESTPAETDSTTETQAVTNAGKGATQQAVEKFITGLKNDSDPEGSTFALLQAKESKVNKSAIKLTWTKVKNAKKYVVYGNKCGKNKPYKPLKTVKKLTYTKKGLKKGTYYKFLVIAFDKNNKVLATSKTIHAATKGGKAGNSKAVTVTNVKKNKLSLKKSKTFTLKTKLTNETAKLTVKNHRKVAFESSNTKIAKVSAKGKITAKKKGTCYVYAYAQNGVSAKVKVTVK